MVKLEGVWFYHRVPEGYHFTIAIWHMEGRWEILIGFYHRSHTPPE